MLRYKKEINKRIGKVTGSFLLGATLLLPLGSVLTSCSNDDVIGPDSEETGGKLPTAFNLEINLALPLTSRSNTTDGGGSSDLTEIGNDKESTITSLDIYLSEITGAGKPEDDVLRYSFIGVNNVEVSTTTESGVIYKVNKVKFEVDPDDFAEVMAERKLRMYFVANGNTSTIFSNPDNSTFTYSSLEGNGIGLYGTDGLNVPLVNKSVTAVLDFTGKNAADIKKMLTDLGTTTLNLNEGISGKLTGTGRIELERAVARVDYKDRDRKSAALFNPSAQDLWDEMNSILPDNMYYLGENSNIPIKVLAMKPVNVSKSAYTFRHTSEGTNESMTTGTIGLFGIENGGGTGYRWVADNDWPLKSNGFHNSPVLSGDVYTMGESGWTDVAQLVSSSDNLDNYQDRVYHCWRYLSENTLPSVEMMKNGVSTGVAFRIQIMKAEGNSFVPATLSDFTSTAGVYSQYGTYDSGADKLTLKLNNKSAKAELEGASGTNDANGKYVYLTYYYWIRHNDKSMTTAVTDPMEFSVVRNNVYKLCIRKFNDLPRPYDPETPDEPNGPDFELYVKVNPWWYYRVSFNW